MSVPTKIQHKEMTSSQERSQWALWIMFWCFENELQHPPDPNHDLCGSLMKRWLSLVSDEERSMAFELTLYTAQLNSHRMLQEWLLWLVHIKADITSVLGLAMISNQWNINAYGTPDRPQQVTSDMTNSTYNKTLSSLLFNEFSPISSSSLASTRLLQLSRKDSALHAACTRLSREWWEGCNTQAVGHHAVPNESQKLSRPQRLFNGNGLCASVNPCPWLEFETTSSQLPFYLWDIELEATVSLKDVKEVVEGYIAVSHTWGRWKLKSHDGSTNFAQVKGVNWEVPKNSRFDVTALPSVLKKLRNDTRYVWMDLLCIPQDRSKRAEEEIARQGAIFRNATKCLCWINDVDGWDGTRVAVEWLLAQYAIQAGDELWPGKLQVPEPYYSNSLCELVPSGKDFYTSGTWSAEEINPWFTSLWTLQEVCIRPDMILCDKAFSVLAIGPISWPVTIADISALLMRVNFRKTVNELVPTAVNQLFNLFAAIGLTNLFKLSRTMILQLGNLRQCSGRRAEAVMSAMGVVDWYLPYMRNLDPGQAESLVLEMYPLPFLEELRARAGSGVFFNDATLDFEMVLKMFYFDNWGDHLKVSGSLLPFGSGKTTNVHDSSIFDDEELITRMWSINELGCVKIQRAFIQANSEDESLEPFLCTWSAPVAVSATLEFAFVSEPSDLKVYLRTFRPERRNFAVSLVRNASIVHGVLLKELTKGVLMKIGSYSWHAPHKGASIIGQEVDVDWTVI